MQTNPLMSLLLTVGMVYVISGIITQYFPPKRINSLYGYRSRRSKLTQQTWDAANRYSSRLFVKLGTLFIVVGAAAYYLPDWGIRQVGIGLMMVVLASIAMGYYTECFLKRKFDDQGNILIK